MRDNTYISSLIIFVICIILLILLLIRFSFRKPVAKKEIPVKILKIIAIISYMFIGGLDEKGFPIFINLIICIFVFFQSFGYHNFDIEWELGVTAILSISTVIIFLKSKIFKDRYLFILCFLALLLLMVSATGILNPNNYKRITIWFILPTTIFIVSSIGIIILNFLKKENKNLKFISH